MSRESQPPPPTPNARYLGRSNTAHLALAKSLFERGRHGQALVEIDAVLRDDPELATGHLLKGLILARLADYAAAQPYLETAVRLDETAIGGWLALAFVRMESGAPDAALRAADRALAASPHHAGAHLMRANILAAQRQTETAIEAYRLAIEHNPQATMAYYKLSSLLASLGREQEALDALLLALRLNPLNAQYRLALGDLLRTRGELHEAVDEYKAAAQLQPDKGEAYERIGVAFRELGYTSEALGAFRLAVRRDPRRVHSFVHIARLYIETGRPAEAVRMAEAALRVDPRFTDAQQVLAEAQAAVEAARNDPARASEHDAFAAELRRVAAESLDIEAAIDPQRAGAANPDLDLPSAPPPAETPPAETPPAETPPADQSPADQSPADQSPADTRAPEKLAEPGRPASN